jgi:hypothetical protein
MDTTNTNPNHTDELSHAGVKGMRWGVRRYQNADGSLTEAGKKRYSSAKRDVMDKARSDAYDKAVKTHLVKNPGDAAGAKAAGRQASKAATATTKVDQDKLLKDMVKKDLNATNTILRESSNLAGTTANTIRNTRVRVKRMDLSQMSDKEMRDRIAREQLESQYDSMFNAKRQRVERGRDTVAGICDGIKLVGGAATTALAIALAIKDLKKG